MSSIDSKEIMQNLGVGTVIAVLKIGIDDFSGKKGYVLELWKKCRYCNRRRHDKRSNQN